MSNERIDHDRSMHVGIIPDGNRRWCKSTGCTTLRLVLKHLNTMLLSALQFESAINKHACLGHVRKISMYMLSKDNLEKRKNDGTLTMVGGVLEGLFWMTLASKAIRCATLEQPATPTIAGEEGPTLLYSTLTPAPAPAEKIPCEDTTSTSEACPQVRSSQSSAIVSINIPNVTASESVIRVWMFECDGDNLVVTIDADVIRKILEDGRWKMEDISPCPQSLEQLLQDVVGDRLSVTATKAFIDAVPATWGRTLLSSILERASKESIAAADYPSVVLQTIADADAATRASVQHNSMAVHVACPSSCSVDACRRVLKALERICWTQITFTGEMHMLPDRMRELALAITQTSAVSAEHEHKRTLDGLHVCFALAYDPFSDVARKTARPEDIDPIDFVIRTSGEQRTSGFFPLETLYSEWMFHPKLFPEFTFADLLKALDEFQARSRRHGA